jgi:protein tyrosine phosphatase (PTP) superfamily phosphohydrolase (DUF442 family)
MKIAKCKLGCPPLNLHFAIVILQLSLHHRWPRGAIMLMAAVTAVSCAQSPARPVVFATTQPLAAPTDIAGVSNFAQVSPHLYRGGQPTARGFERLKQIGIKTVIDLRGKSHRDDIEALGLRYLHIPSSASQPDQQEIIQFLRIAIDPASQPVFIHDERGADRVGLYVAAYRMVEQGWTARDAQAELPRFHFNPFWKQIPQFLDRLEPAQMRRLVEEPPATTSHSLGR